MILGLSHIGLTVGELAQSIRYYQDKFDFPVLSDAERKGEAAEKITGIPGIHTRNVYLSVRPNQHLELFGFYNPRVIPPAREVGFQAGIFYTAFMKERLGRLTKVADSAQKNEWYQWMEEIEEEPYRGYRVVTLQDADGLHLRVVESEGEGNRQISGGDKLLYPAIIVKSMESSVRFYRDILGLEIESQGKGPLPAKRVLRPEEFGAAVHGVLFKSLDGVCLKLIQPLNLKIHPAHPWQMQRVGFTHFAFAVENLDKFYGELLKKGVDFISPPQVASAGPHQGGKGAYLRTENGIVIELIDSPLTRAS